MIERRRRLIATGLVAIAALVGSIFATLNQPHDSSQTFSPPAPPVSQTSAAGQALEALPIKGRAPKTGYSRAQFGNGWQDLGSCNVREFILARDMENETLLSSTDCTVVSGTLTDPYTAKVIQFIRGPDTSALVQIDHVVALSDAWQKGAQQLSKDRRVALANDPLNLLAVDGKTNNDKSDSDAASWLPPNKPYRCRYVARQIAVKSMYNLWVTGAERDAMARVLSTCPDQQLPAVTP